ncbi:mCG147860 [Mus musculus]|nr:mCG147860 [Mus musculus]
MCHCQFSYLFKYRENMPRTQNRNDGGGVVVVVVVEVVWWWCGGGVVEVWWKWYGDGYGGGGSNNGEVEKHYFRHHPILNWKTSPLLDCSSTQFSLLWFTVGWRGKMDNQRSGYYTVKKGRVKNT